MTGSAIDGEDVVQDVLTKAFAARASAGEIENIERWLFRIAHNASLDFLRARARSKTVPITDDMQFASNDPPPGTIAASFRTFLGLSVAQRCAVILKDVLGYSVEEIAEIADLSVPAAKSGLQRGRQRLKALIAADEDGAQLPLLSDRERQQLQDYISLFRSGDFDAIRRMLAEDVRLDLVNLRKMRGKKEVSVYFTRYAEIPHWRFALGAVDGRPAILVFDARGPQDRPAHFILLEWRAGAVIAIQDFVFAPYAMEAADWVRLG
jgi:RNA polymerase sigma-70 factor (ECF subfamily)